MKFSIRFFEKITFSGIQLHFTLIESEFCHTYNSKPFPHALPSHVQSYNNTHMCATIQILGIGPPETFIAGLPPLISKVYRVLTRCIMMMIAESYPANVSFWKSRSFF